MTASLAPLTPRVTISFIGTWVLALLAANLVPVLIGALVNDLGMTVASAGTLVTAMSLGSAGALFATNRLVASGDRPRIARLGLLIMALGFGLGAVTLNVYAVAVGIIVGGIGCGVVIATGTAASSATRNPDATTSTVMIVNRAAAALMLALVPLLGNDLRNILMALTALGLIGILAAGGLPNAPMLVSSPGVREPFGALAIVLALVFGLWSLTEDMVYAMTEILATERVGMTAGESSLLLSFKIVGGLLGAILAPVALKIIGRSWSILIILLVSTGAKFLIVTSTDSMIYSTALVTWGVMYGAVLTLVFGLAARMAVSGRVGVLVSSIYLTGIALGPMVGGALINGVSHFAFGLIVAVPSLITGLILLWVSRHSGVSERGSDDENEIPATPVPAASL